MSIDRVAMAIVAVGEHLDHGLVEDRITYVTAVREAIERGDPDVQPMIDLITEVVRIMVDGPLEAHAREVVRIVAEENKGKFIQMTVPHGPGKGPWELIVRRARVEPKPSSLILPPGARMQ